MIVYVHMCVFQCLCQYVLLTQDTQWFAGEFEPSSPALISTAAAGGPYPQCKLTPKNKDCKCLLQVRETFCHFPLNHSISHTQAGLTMHK